MNERLEFEVERLGSDEEVQRWAEENDGENNVYVYFLTPLQQTQASNIALRCDQPPNDTVVWRFELSSRCNLVLARSIP